MTVASQDQIGSPFIADGTAEVGADAVLLVLYPKPGTAVIRALAKLGDKPILIGQTAIDPLGLPAAVGVPGGADRYVTPATVRHLPDDPEIKEWTALLKNMFPQEEPSTFNLMGVGAAQVMVAALKAAGPNLTGEGFLAVMAHIKVETDTLSSTIVCIDPLSHQCNTTPAWIGMVNGRLRIIDQADRLAPILTELGLSAGKFWIKPRQSRRRNGYATKPRKRIPAEYLVPPHFSSAPRCSGATIAWTMRFSLHPNRAWTAGCLKRANRRYPCPFELRGAVIHSRPEARNAVDPEHGEALYRAFLAFDSDEAADVAVFWGEGGGVLCWGRFEDGRNPRPHATLFVGVSQEWRSGSARSDGADAAQARQTGHRRHRRPGGGRGDGARLMGGLPRHGRRRLYGRLLPPLGGTAVGRRHGTPPSSRRPRPRT